MMKTDATPTPYTNVLDEEYAELCARHRGTLPAAREGAPIVGLAFSGGGIRSATFCLGVLEGLKKLGLLKHVHYLSTVSGGGYIGAWLSANCHRHDHWLDAKTDWRESIAHLRRYSNYLSPEVGFFSADTWSMFTVWLRNTLLVQMTVIVAMACVLLVPPILLEWFKGWPHAGNYRWLTIALFIAGVVGIAGNQLLLTSEERHALRVKTWKYSLGAAVLFLGLAYAFAKWMAFDPFHGGAVDYRAAVPVAGLLVAAGVALLPVALRIVASRYKNPADRPERINYTQGWVQVAIVAPMLLTGYLVAAILWNETQPGCVGVPCELAKLQTYSALLTKAWLYWPFPLSVVFVSLWLLAFFSLRSWSTWSDRGVALLAAAVSMPVLHALLSAIMLLLQYILAHSSPAFGAAHAFVWTPALVLYAFALTIVVLIGILGRQSTEGAREWWSRLGAWLGIYGFAWMVIAVAATYGPFGLRWLAGLHWSTFWPVIGGWAATVAAGLFAGNSGATGNTAKNGRNNRVFEIVAAVAPFVFIAGLLVTVAAVVDRIVMQVDWTMPIGVAATVATTEHGAWFALVPLTVLGACLIVVTLLAARIDINEFSLNAFYRSRLVRCYLGATRAATVREPQYFTGFDNNDDVPLTDLAHPEPARSGPFHIVNCALNLGGSSDLALHTRRGATFIMSPLACGSDYATPGPSGTRTRLGFARTAQYGGVAGEAPTLGQAISVSGAAASPNMGYHTSPVVAFLLTVFNVRLGWWFPNPRKAIRRSSPRFNLKYLFAELFGGASDESNFLMISDGGHFENLAAYELIKRECRVVIICDAECDPDLKFEGLGTLIRMCQVDMGTTIELDVEAIRREAQSDWSPNRCAAGRIKYNTGAPDGVLIYLKASMTGHETTPVLQYKSSHPAFPHESTGDQFYGEDQFESYRLLGHDVACRTFGPIAPAATLPEMIAGADRLLKICSPSLSHQGRFTEHSTQLMKLWRQLAADPNLGTLDRELTNGSWPDSPPAGFRPSYYLCCALIQLMENVYLDLNLEDTWDHADTSGWNTLFTNWTKSPAFKSTWTMTKDVYGVRFQYFCNRNLGLPL
jgi:hypothetical protein